MSKLEQQKEHFESISEKYFSTRKDIKHNLVKEATWETFFSQLDLDFDSKPEVLEAMCGAGDGYDILSKYIPDFEYSAFDYSEKMVDFAKEKFQGKNIYWADITKLNQVEEYDLILVIGGLHHVYQHKELAVENISKALKPNGYFICYEPTHNNILLRKVREYTYKKNALFDEETERAFTTNELNTLMQTYNLDLVKQTFPGLLAYVLWYNPDAFPFLNKGSNSLVKFVLACEKRFYASSLAKFFSFSTLSCYKKI